jgi:hypothetical protein
MFVARGTDTRDLAIGIALSALAGPVAIIFSAVLPYNPYLPYGLVPAIAFAAFYVRRFGPRYLTIGTLALFAYLVTTDVRPSLTLAVIDACLYALGIGIALLFKAFLLPRRRDRACLDSVVAFFSAAAELLNRCASDLATARPPSRRAAANPMGDEPLQSQLSTIQDYLDRILAQGGTDEALIPLVRVIGGLELSLHVVAESVNAIVARSAGTDKVRHSLSEALSALAARCRMMVTGGGTSQAQDETIDALRDSLLQAPEIEPDFAVIRCRLALDRAHRLLDRADTLMPIARPGEKR